MQPVSEMVLTKMGVMWLNITVQPVSKSTKALHRKTI